MKVAFVLLMLAALSPALCAQESTHPVEAAISSGDFEQASRLISKIPEQADNWLGKLALAQVSSGDAQSAKDLLRRIHDSGQLAQASQAVAAAQGGATGADFDSLINLITTTVEPDSWDDVGGPGTVQSFPGGVDIDARGVVRKKIAKSKKKLDILRKVASQRRQTGDVRRSSKLRMVSLPRLERELMLRVAFGESATEAMRHLAGIYEIQYLFLFPDTNDIVIAGPAAAWEANATGQAVTEHAEPVLLLDDLVTLLKNARDRQGKFGCSIDPKQESLAQTKEFLDRRTGTLTPRQTKRWVEQIRGKLGLQDIRVYGVDPQSHVGRVLVEADYHMKLVGMGLEPGVAELPSYLDSLTVKTLPKAMDVLRWWFTFSPDPLTKNSQGNAFAFSKQTVRLQTENERISGNGDRNRAGKTSLENQEFAHRFTQHYDRLCQQYPIYAELENLFRLSLVAGILNASDTQSQVDWDADWLIRHVRTARGPKPAEVASIVNHRVINRKHVIVGVSGGVTVNVANYVGGVKRTRDNASLESARATAHRKPKADAWWWD